MVRADLRSKAHFSLAGKLVAAIEANLWCESPNLVCKQVRRNR